MYQRNLKLVLLNYGYNKQPTHDTMKKSKQDKKRTVALLTVYSFRFSKESVEPISATR